MRDEVSELVRLGSLPPESSQGTAIAERQALLEQITPPLSLSEARALAGILGPDDCFGLAWSVVHLIESAPGWSTSHIPLGASPFLAMLRSRASKSRGVDA